MSGTPPLDHLRTVHDGERPAPAVAPAPEPSSALRVPPPFRPHPSAAPLSPPWIGLASVLAVASVLWAAGVPHP